MMGYELYKYYTIKSSLWENCEMDIKYYPWPCRDNMSRVKEIYRHDVFTIKSEENGMCSVIKHNGICCIGILIPKSDLEEKTDKITLGII